jgi:hypothetical protein
MDAEQVPELSAAAQLGALSDRAQEPRVTGPARDQPVQRLEAFPGPPGGLFDIMPVVGQVFLGDYLGQHQVVAGLLSYLLQHAQHGRVGASAEQLVRVKQDHGIRLRAPDETRRRLHEPGRLGVLWPR